MIFKRYVNIMNQVQRISHRAAWCQLKRLQSSVSTSNSQIQIPIRIKRKPTDILRALANTVPKYSLAVNHPYQDDPYLLPLRKHDYRNYALSYESGKKTAMWIHKEHSDVFPKHLSDPEIEAFAPPTKHVNKDQVSEEILQTAISKFNISEALCIYKLLEDDVSNQTKQALFELLCFYNDDSNILLNLPYERWYTKFENKLVWKFTPEINKLYEFLTKQDSATAAAAHNVMICGFARFSRVDEAWSIYQQCIKQNVPLNVTAYNHILSLLPLVFKRGVEKVHHMLHILRTMNDKGIKPNVGTLNASLKTVYMTKMDQSKHIAKHLLTEFRRIDVKLSLTSYYYALMVFAEDDQAHDSYTDFVDILCAVDGKSFKNEDSQDCLFFPKAMQLANIYTDRKAADLIHNLLTTGNHKDFISDTRIEHSYYSAYLCVLLSTSATAEFMKHYTSLIPHEYVPTRRIMTIIVEELGNRNPQDLMEYLPKLWYNVNDMYTKDLSLQYILLRVMAHIDNLPIESPLRAAFLEAAMTCANNIKSSLAEDAQTNIKTIPANMVGCIAKILISNGKREECAKILVLMLKKPAKFMPLMSQKEVEDLFDICLSTECIEPALLVLQYSTNAEYPCITDMARKLHKLPQFTHVDWDKLINSVQTKTLNTFMKKILT